MYDIVCSLPLELLVQIVEYLDLEDVARSQRVSKRWGRIFSCETIIKPFLRKTLLFLGLDVEGVSAESVMPNAASYFRWERGLQHARAVRKIFLAWPSHVPGRPSDIQYHSRRLCYSPPKRDRIGTQKEVEMLDLATGEFSTWEGSGRGQVKEFMLSDREQMEHRGSVFDQPAFDRFSGYYDLTAWDIHTKQKLIQQIPTFCVLYTIAEDKVVIGFEFIAQPRPVHVWDLSSNHIQEIGNFSYLVMCHMNSADNVLVAFEIDKWKQPPQLRQSKWTTAGQLLEERTLHVPMLADYRLNLTFPLSRNSCRTYGRKTVAQLFFDGHLHSVSGTKYVAMHLEYDHIVDQLRVRWVHRTSNSNAAKTPPINLTPYLFYRRTMKDGQTVIYNAATGTEANLSTQSLDIQGASGGSLGSLHCGKLEVGIGQYHANLLVHFGDREVFGLGTDDGVHLWLFNPSFPPSSDRRIVAMLQTVAQT